MSGEDNRINVGDLVAVVRGHECLVRRCGGIPFVLKAIHTLHPLARGYDCAMCGERNVIASREYVDAPASCYAPIAWLKKYPPLSDGESIDALMEAPVLPETVA